MDDCAKTKLEILFEEKHPFVKINEIYTERFTNVGMVHDWRNHIPVFLKPIWHQLSLDAVIAFYMVAEQTAKNEEWD